jgi:hypothetical protein
MLPSSIFIRFHAFYVPAGIWYGWNDDRYCVWGREQCIPGPFAVNSVTCYLDSKGYVVGLKYYYTDGTLGGQLGYCNGASQSVNAGDWGVFVGVYPCHGAWGGYKSITWFNDHGDKVTCGNTRTDLSSWDYWGSTWNAPQPSRFLANWLNPDVWGHGYWNFFAGYPTQNRAFQSKFASWFSMWSRRSREKLENAQTGDKALFLDHYKVKTAPYWETCQYVNRYVQWLISTSRPAIAR